jgi:hypothetical protein
MLGTSFGATQCNFLKVRDDHLAAALMVFYSNNMLPASLPLPRLPGKNNSSGFDNGYDSNNNYHNDGNCRKNNNKSGNHSGNNSRDTTAASNDISTNNGQGPPP